MRTQSDLCATRISLLIEQINIHEVVSHGRLILLDGAGRAALCACLLEFLMLVELI